MLCELGRAAYESVMACHEGVVLLCSAEHGLNSTIRDLSFSPAHKDKVKHVYTSHMLHVLPLWQTVSSCCAACVLILGRDDGPLAV